MCGVSKNLEARISVYQTHTYFYVSILINLWTMSIRMNGPHAKTTLSYTFILMPVKARKKFSSKLFLSRGWYLTFDMGFFSNFCYWNSKSFVTESPISKLRYRPLSNNYFLTANISSFHWYQYERVTHGSFCVKIIHSNGHCP